MSKLYRKYSATLTKETELFLAMQYISGDKKAKREFITSNIKLAISFAKKFKAATLTHTDIEDLIQVAIVGMLTAVEKFDPTLGNKFSTYANCWITQALYRNEYNTKQAIRLPVWVYVKLTLYKKCLGMQVKEHVKLNGLDRTVEILEVKTQDKPATIRDVLIACSFSITSIDAHIDYDDDNITLLDKIVVLQNTENVETLDKVKIRKIIKNLVAQCIDGEIIEKYYGLNGVQRKSLKEIGDGIGISREAIRQRKNKALELLLKKIRALSTNEQKALIHSIN